MHVIQIKLPFPFLVRIFRNSLIHIIGITVSCFHLGDTWTLRCVLDKMWSLS